MLAGLSARLAPLGQPRGGLTSPQTAPGAAARLTHARRPANRRPQAAAAAGGDRNGGGGASGPRRPRTIALAAASRAPFGEVLPAELLAKYQEQQQVGGWAPTCGAACTSTAGVHQLPMRSTCAAPVQAEAHAGGRPFVLPLLVFPLPELPTESLALPVQEGCYREMFALVERSASRLFGAVLAHPEAQSIESGVWAVERRVSSGD